MARPAARARRRSVFTCTAVAIALLGFGRNGRAQQARELIVERDLSQEITYRCVVSLPAGYEEDAGQSWPLVLFLHGGGSPTPQKLRQSIDWLAALPAVVVAPICPPSLDGARYTNWNWKMLGDVVREASSQYRLDEKRRSVIGFSMGGSGAWELPFYEPELFSKSVVVAGVCHPWSLRHYPKIPVWAFVGTEDSMRKEQQETITSARRFGVDVVESTWPGADHGQIFRHVRTYQPLLRWLVTDDDLRVAGEIGNPQASPPGSGEN